MMFDLSDDLKNAVSEFNKKLSLRLEESISKNDVEIRELINEKIGTLKSIEPASKEELFEYQKLGGIVGVDGSVNRVGGAHPHYVDVFQGLAKSTVDNKKVFIADCDSPLIEDFNMEIEGQVEQIEVPSKRDKLLAEIELKVALKGIKELEPYILMMDGSLLRYRIYSESLWEELKEEALAHNTILMGVIKDIKTSMFKDALLEDGVEIHAYDREMLYGKLKYKELVLIDDTRNHNKKSGFTSCFLRSSIDPNVIGIDIISEQADKIEEMAKLTLALTPHNSRGVPLWLDITDNEVKISDKIVRAILSTGLNRRNYEMFIMSERQKR